MILAVLPSSSPRDQVLVHLLAGAGLRREEASALDVGDLRLDAEPPYLVVRHGKGDKYGEVLIPQRLAELLRALVGFRRDGPVLLSRKRNLGDGRLTGDAINGIVDAVGRRAGLPVRMVDLGHGPVERCLHAHQLRHFHASVTLRQTGNLRFVQKQLRHSSLQISQVYMDLFLADGANYCEAVDKFLCDPATECVPRAIASKPAERYGC